MEHLAQREDDQPNSLLNYIDKPSIIRAQLTPKPPNRDVSFSTYLKPNDTLLQTEGNFSGHRPQDSEISIFDADKYFNGVHTVSNPKQPDISKIHRLSLSTPKQPETSSIRRLSLSTPKQSVSSISRLSSVSDDSYGRNYRGRSFHATPTASSEASWNSQTGLLTNPPGLAPISIRNLPSGADRTSKKSGASMNWLLRGNICPCSGKKSDRMASATGNGFTFPILNSKAAPSKRNLNIVQPSVLVAEGGASAEETPRDSIEVFQPREGGVGRNFALPASPKSRRASYDDDICSDASSDLFEIESFSTTTATQTTLFPRRDSLDDPATTFNMRRLQIATFNKSTASSVAIAGLAEEEVDEPVTPSVAPTECYAPSEVSVDWSVTTAEGFDRASLAGFSMSASEFAYPALRDSTKGGSSADETRKKGNSGLLTSCRCEKAVNVGPQPIKYQPEIRPSNTTRIHVTGRSQAPIRINGVSNTNNNISHSHAITRSTRSTTLMPVPFVAESLAHRHSL